MKDSYLWVVVTGGRAFADIAMVQRELDALHAKQGIAVIVHGGATGADTHAEGWAARRSVPCLRVPARWDEEGKAAGPKRNERMLSLAVLGARGCGGAVQVIAFPGGRGTASCIELAKRRDLPVREL